MTNYTKAVDFAAKDSLTTGNSAKIVKGTEIDTEFNAISTAIATKANIAGPTFTGTVTIPTATISTVIVPDASDGATIGSSSLEFSDIYLADGALIYLGDDQDTTLTHVADTGILLNSTRQLQFGDSGTYIHQSADGVLDLVADTEIEINATTIDINGAADVSGNLAVGGNLTVTGTATIAGNLTFGDAASDTVAFTADVASNLLPSADNSYDLGASGSEWKDLFLDGTAHIDTLDIDENAAIAGTLAVTGVISPTTHIDMPDSANIKLGAADDLQMYHDGSHSYITNATGTMKIATETSGIAVTIGHTTSETTVADNLTVTGDTSIGGNLTVTGTTSFSGNQTFGNAASDTVTFSADIASDLLPSADGTHDLGASGAEWEDLFIDGTANIDSLVADTADINGGTVDGAIIGGASAAAGTFTTISGTTVTASTSLKTPLIEYTDGDDAITIADGGGVTIADLTATTADINGGTIDGTVIGGASAAAGTFAAITGTTGTFSSNVTISTADNTDTLTLTSTDADASVGPTLALYRNSSSPADSDIIGSIDFDGRNDNSQDVQYSRIITQLVDASDGTEDATLYIQTIAGGTNQDRITIKSSETVFNEDSNNLDFRVESDGNANRLFVDAGADQVLFGTTASRVMTGVTPSIFQEGTSYDLASLGLVSNTNAANGAYLMLGTSRGTSNGSSTVVQDNDELGGIFWHGADGTDIASAAGYITVNIDGTPGSNDMPGSMHFATTADGASSATERMRIDSAGKIMVGTSTANGHVSIDPADGVADEAYALFVRNNEATDGRNYGLTVRAGSTSADESFSVRDHANASTYFTVRGDGNVGIGVTPEAWNSSWQALRIGDRGAVYSQASTTLGLAENVYYDSGWKAIATAVGSLMQFDSGGAFFYHVPSVSAGATSSPSLRWKMTDTEMTVYPTSGNSQTGAIDIYGTNGSSFGGSVIARSRIASTTDGTAYGSYQSFWTTNTSNVLTEAMRINDDQRVMIGQTSPGVSGLTSAKFSVGQAIADYGVALIHTNASDPYGYVVKYTADVPNDDTHVFYLGGDSSAWRFYAASNGDVFTVSGTDIQAISDKRLKENANDFTDGLKVLNTLNPVTYTWKEGYGQDKTGTQYGFLAQDIEASSEVKANMNLFSKKTLGVDPTFPKKDLIDDDIEYASQLAAKDALYISAIQELSKEIETLKAEVKALKEA